MLFYFSWCHGDLFQKQNIYLQRSYTLLNHHLPQQGVCLLSSA